MSTEFAGLSVRYWRSPLSVATFALGLCLNVSAEQTCQLSTPQWSKMEIRSVRILRANEITIKIRPRLADESGERSAGYQHICPQIIDLSSILFVYDSPVKMGFHMFNIHKELDIGFFDSNKELIEVLRMTPQQIEDPLAEFYEPGQEFQYALETWPGFFEQNELTPGSAKLVFP